jgi:protein-S-isoprenylcysteine O-methyltransferase Ste14
MRKILSLSGVGPKLILFTILYSFLLEKGIKHYCFDISLKIVPYDFLVIAGTLLILSGISLLVPSFIAISKLRKTDRLYTSGVYSVCRHPLYSSWIIFIVPGMVLFLNSLLSLTIPLVMYLIFRVLINKEEAFLLKKYGDQYCEYQNHTGLLFPVIWRYKGGKEL